VQSFLPSTEKGAANVAQALGFRERQMVKTLIFETDAGLRALVMLGGDQNAVSGLLKKALGSRNISLAKPEIVKEVTGYVIGSIPPFHWQPEGFLTLLEASLMDEPVLGVGAGLGYELRFERFVLFQILLKKVIYRSYICAPFWLSPQFAQDFGLFANAQVASKARVQRYLESIM
jgi:Cys-tRNA(Pro)/Cys-tRNA(Cys) deacylase